MKKSSTFSRRLIVLAVFLPFAGLLASADASLQYFGVKPGSLARAKAMIATGDKDYQRALKNLLSDADEALRATPPSVVEKSATPPSGDKHDYMSLAPYFWPNPKSKNGLPYVRHDGKVNPESRDPKFNDSPRLRQLGDSVETLALAYYFTSDEKYATAAAKFLRTWFLDTATRMNPNFKFAQAVRGENDGRGTGILEARHIATVADAARLLAGSKAWTSDNQAALQAWLEKYFDWLLTSKPGREERAAENNHGTWFDVQAVELALCLGRTNEAVQMLEAAKQIRIARQIQPDGRQPLELARTAAFSYSVFNLEALAELATLGEHAGIDLWRFQTDDGRGIRGAIQFLLPYYNDPAKKWPYQQIHKISADGFPEILQKASLVYADSELKQAAERRPDLAAKKIQLLFNQ